MLIAPKRLLSGVGGGGRVSMLSSRMSVFPPGYPSLCSPALSSRRDFPVCITFLLTLFVHIRSMEATYHCKRSNAVDSSRCYEKGTATAAGNLPTTKFVPPSMRRVVAVSTGIPLHSLNSLCNSTKV